MKSANTHQLAKNIEIYTLEFNEVISEFVNLNDDLKNKLRKYNRCSSIVVKQLREFDEEKAVQVSLRLRSVLEGTLQFENNEHFVIEESEEFEETSEDDRGEDAGETTDSIDE